MSKKLGAVTSIYIENFIYSNFLKITEKKINPDLSIILYIETFRELKLSTFQIFCMIFYHEYR